MLDCMQGSSIVCSLIVVDANSLISYFISQRIASTEEFKHSTVDKARVAKQGELNAVMTYQPTTLFDTYCKALVVTSIFGMLRVDDERNVQQKSVTLVTDFSAKASVMR